MAEALDGNPREAMRAKLKAAEDKVAGEYDKNVRRRSKEGNSIIGGGTGIDTPREHSDSLKMLSTAPRGLTDHLRQTGIKDVRTASGLSVLSRQGQRQKNDRKTYVPLRGAAFKERMAQQHMKMAQTFGYVPPAELPKIEHKKSFEHFRRPSLMTRGTKRKLERANEAMSLLTRQGNGWVVNWRTRKSALEHIHQEGTAALSHIDEIVRKLKDADWGVRAAAADVVANMGEAAEPFAEHIINILEDPNPTVRSSALKALPKLGGDVARLHWKKIVHALEHDDSDKVRNTAFEVIREMCLIKPGAEREERERAAQEALQAHKEEEVRQKLEALKGKKSPNTKGNFIRDAQKGALRLVTLKGAGSRSPERSPQ